MGWLRIVGIVAVGLTVAALATVLASGGTSPPPGTAPADPSGNFPHPSRVAVYVLENTSYQKIIGSSQAPYFNRLAQRHALATHYYGVTHPSLPNYIAMTGGSIGELIKDCKNCDSPGPNVVGQLDAAGHSWKAYFEELTTNLHPGSITPSYNPHYNPFVYYESVRGKDQNRDRVVGFDHLRAALTKGKMADFTWIAPGVRHDGHNGSLRQADRFAAGLVPLVLQALGPNGVLYLTWDEGNFSDTRGVSGARGGGKVVLIAAGGAAQTATTEATPANHYALLRTIEANFGLTALGHAGDPSTPLLGGLLKPAG